MNLFEAGVEGTESKLCVSYRVSGMEFGRLNLRKWNRGTYVTSIICKFLPHFSKSHSSHWRRMQKVPTKRQNNFIILRGVSTQKTIIWDFLFCFPSAFSAGFYLRCVQNRARNTKHCPNENVLVARLSAGTWPRTLSDSLYPKCNRGKPRFDPGTIHGRFVTERVAVGKFMLERTWLFPFNHRYILTYTLTTGTIQS